MSDRQIIDWPAWTDSPPGRYVLGWEQAQLDRIVSDVFGFHALQLGLPQLDALRENRMPYRGLVLDPASGASAPYQYPWAREAHAPEHAPDGRSTTWCDLLDLPFESQSVDLIVMPHTLEFTSD
ncbi:SAM-dependent methyltransferase, partial [Burkholderia contaminans]